MDELNIVENPKQKTVMEAFGMSEKTYDRIFKAMTTSIAIQLVDHFKTHGDKGHKCDGSSKTARLSAFLVSKEYKALKWTPKTANDFFILGYMFNSAVRKSESLIGEYVTERVGDLLGNLPGVKIEIVNKR